MLDLLIGIIFFIILIPKIKVVKNYNSTAISLQTSQSLKGILCIVVFLNHFSGLKKGRNG